MSPPKQGSHWITIHLTRESSSLLGLRDPMLSFSPGIIICSSENSPLERLSPSPLMEVSICSTECQTGCTRRRFTPAIVSHGGPRVASILHSFAPMNQQSQNIPSSIFYLGPADRHHHQE